MENLMLITSAEIHLCLQQFYYIVNNGTASIMHYCPGESSHKTRFMKMRKIPAFGKPVTVNWTFLLWKKMAGNRVDDKLSSHALFNIVFPDLRWGFIQWKSKVIHFLRLYIYHQVPAAVTATGAIYWRFHFFIDRMDFLIYPCIFRAEQKRVKQVVIVLFCLRIKCYRWKICNNVLAQMIELYAYPAQN